MRVLVCGSRTFSKRHVVFSVLDGIAMGRGDDPDVVVIHGGATGADSLGGDWAMTWNHPCEVYAADWELFGKSAGPIRNLKMLNEGKPDLVVAFIDKSLPASRGTNHMANISRRANVETWVVQI